MSVVRPRLLLPALLAAAAAGLGGGDALAQVRGTIGQSTERLFDPASDPRSMRQGNAASGAGTAQDQDSADTRRSRTSGRGAANELASGSVVNPNTRAQVRKRIRAAMTLTRPPNRVVRAPERAPMVTGGIAPLAPPARALPEVIAPGLTEPMPERRKKRKADDPYAPLGLRMGGLTINAGVDLQAGYDSNALREGSGGKRKGSMLYQVTPDIAVMSDWSRHQLQVELKGAYLYYPDVDDANRPNLDGRLQFRGDVSRDTTLNIELRERVDTQRPGSVDLTNAVKGRPAYYTHSGTLGVTQRFGYASVTAAAMVDRTTYDNGTTYAGNTYDQQDRNFTSYGARLRGAYEITPGIAPFVEVLADTRQYDQEIDRYGYKRSSQGVTGRVGTTFEITQQLTGEVGVGYGVRTYGDTRLANLSGVLVDSQLAWQASPLTKVTVKATSELLETTSTGSSGAVNRKLSVDVAHDLLRNLTVTGSLGYGNALYQGLGRMEQTITSGLKFDYKIDRTFVVRGSYAYERAISEMAGQGYLSHTFLMGLRIQR